MALHLDLEVRALAPKFPLTREDGLASHFYCLDLIWNIRVVLYQRTRVL